MTSTIELASLTPDTAHWIEPHRKAFMDWVAHHGYSAFCTRLYRRTITSFCLKLGKRPLEKPPLERGTLKRLQRAVLKTVPESDLSHATFRLGRFVDYLAEVGVASPPQQPTKRPTRLDQLRSEYANYLHVQRGLSEGTIRSCLNYFDRFIEHRFEGKLGDLNKITPDHVLAFLRQLRSKTRPDRRGTSPSHLRSFFKFLFWSGRTRLNLALSVPRIAHSRAADLPRFVKPEVVEQLVEAARSDDIIGRRNYAMLLLLARMGLRAPEVVAIQLEDIDWRAGEILIRGKGKRHDRMPLPRDIGEAIVSYIRNGRVSDSRALFVSGRAPHQAFKDAQIVNYVLKTALQKAGLKQPQKYIGSHLLRHSLATTMLGKGASLDEIGHVLRHRARATTTIYAKCDVAALRSIAKTWPVEGGAQ
jgi:integrase/recombinase XerD